MLNPIDSIQKVIPAHPDESNSDQNDSEEIQKKIEVTDDALRKSNKPSIEKD